MTQNSKGDLIVGSEDYKIRLFTRDPTREASADELAEYQEELVTKTTATDQQQFNDAPDFKDAHKYQGKGEGDF